MQDLPDFDTLKNLAAEDPDALEALRQQHVDALISSAPAEHQRRLRGLQFQIDAQRQIHSQPMSACIKISQMMYESFTEMRYLLNEMTDQGVQRPRVDTPATAEPAKVLDFSAQ
ncbi:DUF3135 domain-containing protein [Aurantivibrio plasticivorans]